MQVFLSHTSSDRGFARKVATALESAGFSVWSNDDLLPGDDAFRRVSEELERSDAMVVLVTPDWSRSDWVRRELDYALSGEKYRQKIFPLFVGWSGHETQRDYPWILDRLTTFTAPANGEGEVLNELAATLKRAH